MLGGAGGGGRGRRRALQAGNKRVIMGIIFQLINRFHILATLSRGEGSAHLPDAAARPATPGPLTRACAR